MDRNMKDNLKVVIKKEGASTILIVVTNMKVNGRIIKEKEREYNIIIMVMTEYHFSTVEWWMVLHKSLKPHHYSVSPDFNTELFC